MANPVLDRGFKKAETEERPGWAAPATLDGAAATTATGTTPPGARTGELMTVGGAITASLVLFAILLAFGVWGWSLVDAAPATGEIDFPGWLGIVLIGTIGLAIIAIIKPQASRIVAPIYAAGQGLFLGAISKVYELQWDGIVVQAILATFVVFAVMLLLYATRVIKVTERMRSVVIGATLGIAVFYMASILLSFFGAEMPFVWDSGPFGILFSLAVIAVAAFNLLLDFDVIERGAAFGLPKYYEWFAAWGLMVTVVWLYLEMLRLLAKLRN